MVRLASGSVVFSRSVQRSRSSASVDLEFLKNEVFWVAVGAVASSAAAITNAVTLRALFGQMRAADDATMADLPPPYLNRNDDDRGRWVQLFIPKPHQMLWGIVSVQPARRGVRLQLVEPSYDNFGRVREESRASPSRKLVCRPSAELYVDLVDGKGRPAKSDLLVTVASHARPRLRTTFKMPLR
jgi:hypothetical protein